MRDAESKEKKSHAPAVRIRVVGVGGGGGNAVSRMCGDFARGVEFVAVNTDVQDLEHCAAKVKINIGRSLTKGLGAGMNPEVGRQAAEESRLAIIEALQDAELVFLTAGMGGGTGTGATPVVADIAREIGALTIAVVTKPFAFEGSERARIAEEGVQKLKEKVDALITIPNDRIFSIISQDTPIMKAFVKIDEILKNTVQGISDLIASAGLINVDFADVRAIMQGAGHTLVGFGQASGKDRAVKAATQAVSSPLLDRSVEGARRVLFGIAGGHDLTMTEVNEAAKLVTANVDPNARIIFGAYFDRKIKTGQFRVTLVATSFDGNSRDYELGLFTPSKAEVFFGKKIEPAEAAAVAEGAGAGSASEEGADEQMPTSDLWDIPAFLRRKKR